MEDTINRILNSFLNCACEALDDAKDSGGNPCGCPCRFFVAWGPVVWDREGCCSDGQLSVQLDRIYPTSVFPSQDNMVNICQSPLSADITITLLRCYPVLDGDGSAPTHLELQEAGELLGRDLAVLTKGLLCCSFYRGNQQQFVYLGSRPLPPNGGCAGVEVRFSVDLIEPL